MRTTTLSSLALASFGGGAVFAALLPWADPCAFHGYAGGPCPSYVDDVPLGGLRNAAFALICLATGFAAGKLCPSHRPLIGAVSVFLAVVLAGLVGHVLVYGIHAPLVFTPPGNGFEWAMTIAFLAMLAALGVVGAVASMWSPNFRWRRR